jgi:tetratricopeptide (TPR) repeat protein
MRALVLSLSLLSCFGVSGIHAQQTPAVSYAAEPFVVERLETIYRMQADGTGVREKTVEVQVQTESALKDMAVVSVPFAANSEHVEWVYARIRHKDGATTETPLTGAIEIAAPVTREAPFYSDLKASQLPLKDLRVGDRVEWKWRVVRTKSEAVGQFWGAEGFDRTGVVLAESMVLDVPKDVAVTVWSPKSKAGESVEGDRHIYRWTSDNKKPTVGAEATAAAEAEKKRVRTADEELDDRLGKLPDVAWTTFKSWEAVGAWYRGLEGERMTPDAEIKAKVAQVTAGKTTDREKVEAVYSYVATQIHYIGVAFGIGRYQPHSAGDVLGNQYGDCKDKHTLLAAMIEALGMHPDAVLIGAGIRFNQAVPSPAAFNHLITRVELDGKPVWLDTTAEVAPFGMLLALTRDHEALVIPVSGPSEVERTPARPPFANTTVMEAKGTLDADGVSTSRLTLTLHGDVEVLMRSVIRQVSPAQYDVVAQQFSAGMGYGGTASHMEVSRVDDTTTPFTMSFDYKRVKGGDWDNLRTVPQLSPVAVPSVDDKEPPVEAIELGPVRVETSNSEMKLPDGWTAELPEAVHEKSAWATFDQTYRFEKGTLYAQRRTETLVERVPQADWKAYSKFAQKANNSEMFVQLVRKPGSDGRAITVPVEPSNGGVANELAGDDSDLGAKIEKAYQALQKHKPDVARPLLEQVLAINPNQPRLWGCYGDLAMQSGDMSTAVRDYQKELELHPSAVQVYPVLIRLQRAMNRTADAKESLHRWVEAAPNSEEAALTLAEFELAGGRELDAQFAVITLETALRNVQTDRLKLQLGRAQLKAGKKDEGRLTLIVLVKNTDDPGIMNDAAYELADAGVELPLAEETIRKALASMEEESKTWTLDENVATLRSKTALLQATWDSLGWVLFREGKIDEAEGYVRAAWMGHQDREIGQHMAEIALTKGHKDQALSYYAQALATLPNFDAMGVHKEPDGEQKELMAAVEKLRKQGAREIGGTPGEALIKLRNLPMGKGESGYAEYKILFNAQGPVRAEPLEGKTIPDVMTKLKSAKLNSQFPAGSTAQLVETRLVNCHEGQCELMMMQ